MLSRIAETLYWIGRYLERAENTARLLQVNSYALAELPNEVDANDLAGGDWANLRPLNNQIRDAIARARENGSTVRFHVNVEMWEALNRAYNGLGPDPTLATYSELSEFCAAVREACNLFFGIAEATLPRNEAWYFLAVGRYLERVDDMLRFLHDQYSGGSRRADDQVIQDQRSRAFLRSVGAYEAFRKHENTSLDPTLVANFLLLDDSFPRSVRWSARHLSEALHALSAMTPGSGDTCARLAGWLAAQLQYRPSITEVMRQGRAGLNELLRANGEIADAIDKAYFSRTDSGLLVSIPQAQQQHLRLGQRNSTG